MDFLRGFAEAGKQQILSLGKKRLGNFFFKNLNGKGNQIFSRNDHNIHRRRYVVLNAPKHIPDFSLGPISSHGVANFFRSDDAESLPVQPVGNCKNSAIRTDTLPQAIGHDLFKLVPFGQSLSFIEGIPTHWLYGQSFPPFPSAVGQYFPPSYCGSPCPKPVCSLPANIFWLVCSLHSNLCLGFTKNKNH